MRKAGLQAALVPIVPLVLPEINPLVEYEKKRRETMLKGLEKRIEMLEDDRTNAQDRIAEAEDTISCSQDEIGRYEEEIAEMQKMLAETQKMLEATRKQSARVSPKVKAILDTALNSLLRHKWIAGIRQDGYSLIVTTRLLFTDIRKEAGSREVGRVCIGAYELQLRYDATQSLIRNLLFTSRYHWATTSGNSGYVTPCLGEWKAVLLKAPDTYTLVDTFLHYLRDTNDASAYIKSHDWRDGRVSQFNQLVVGGYVVTLKDYQDAPIRGKVGILHKIRNGNGCVEFKEPFVGGHDLEGLLSKRGYGWNMPLAMLRPITCEEWESGKAKPQKIDEALAKIDALPDGSPLSEAIMILKAYEIAYTP